jgi:hypothetical protein
VVDVAEIDAVSDPNTNIRRLALLAGEPTDGEEFGFGAADGADSGAVDTGPRSPWAHVQEQQYHMQLVRLFAACCEGENQQIVAMCQSIFTLEELLATLTSAAIAPLVKSPYIAFFLWSYLNTASPVIRDALSSHPQLYTAMAALTKKELSTCFQVGSNTRSLRLQR